MIYPRSLSLILGLLLVGSVRVWCQGLVGTDRYVRVVVGESELVELGERVERIHIDPAGMLEAVMPRPGAVNLKGTRVGHATVLVHYASGELGRLVVEVAPRDSEAVKRLTKELRKRLAGIAGLDIRSDGAGIVLSGAVDEAEKELIRPYAEMLEGLVRDATTPKARTAAPRAVPVPERVPEDYSKKIVQIDVKILQVSKEESEKMGVEWFERGGWRVSAEGIVEGGYQATTGSAEDLSISGGGGLLSLVEGNGAFATAEGRIGLSNLEWAIEALEREGHAKVLATPKLTVQSGQSADFLVGGELPIVQVNALSSTVEYKRFGTQLDILPIVISEEEVYITVRASVSAVDNLQRVQGVPGIRTREASTIVTVRDGISFALAGLLSTERTQFESSVPVLSKMPVLGGLFRSSRVVENDIETIIFMTPHILTSGGETKPPDARITPGPAARELLESAPQVILPPRHAPDAGPPVLLRPPYETKPDRKPTVPVTTLHPSQNP